MKISKVIDKNLDDFFWNIINSRTAFLRNINNEYKKIYTEILGLEKEETLRDFFNEKKVKNLSEEEAEMILKYLQLIEDKHVIEMKDIFYSAFAISKDILDRLTGIRNGIN